MNPRIAVLASGVGSNLQALLEDPAVAPRIALVVSDRPDARASRRAEVAGIESIFLDPAEHTDRRRYDDALLALLRDRAIGYVVNAGFMRILGRALVQAFDGRCLNVHPSLLPAFAGANAVSDALAWGVKVTGATVHVVDEEVDHGPIVAQEVVPVVDGDDEWSLHARIQLAEHRIYAPAVRALVEGRVRIDGRHVTIAGER
jgi:phosphoribosylglycinamide formyltransferase 1